MGAEHVGGAGSLACMAGSTERKRITIDSALLDQARAAISPAASLPDAELVERALRLLIGRRALQASQDLSDLTEEQAIELANSELHAARRERSHAA